MEVLEIILGAIACLLILIGLVLIFSGLGFEIPELSILTIGPVEMKEISEHTTATLGSGFILILIGIGILFNLLRESNSRRLRN